MQQSTKSLGYSLVTTKKAAKSVFITEDRTKKRMDGDPNWDNRHTRFMGEVYAGDELEVEYSISNKVEENSERYGILSIDLQIRRISDNKLVIVSR